MIIKDCFFVGRLLLLALLVGLFVTTQAMAVDAFPTKIPTKAETLEAVVKLIPGLDKAHVSNFKAGNNAASGDIKIKGKTVTVVAFKRSGISKVLIAIAPSNFKLTDFLPIPHGTPIDGVTFKNMAFVYVPKAAVKKNVSTSGLPQKVIAALGSKVDFHEGLNLFGKADFASSGGVKKVLQAIGLNNFTLPLNGTLPKELFKHDPKTVSGKIKDQLLDALRLELKLKKLRIPGMPSTVFVKNAGLTILSRKPKNKRQFIAGVNGTLSAKIGSKEQTFAFYILADKAGANSKVTIKGDTKDKLTLPFFHPLALTAMNLEATKSGGKWDVVVNAKAKLNNKKVDVAVTHDPKDGTSAEIKGKIKLSDLLPGSVSIPGITDVEFDDLQINKEFMQVTGKVKKLDTVIAVFKRSGKTYVAINNPRPIKISSLITAAKGTPLDDASFEHMSYIWAPKGGAEKGMELSALPPDIAYNVKQVVKKVDLKEGLNVIGRMEITQQSKIGKILTQVGIHKNKLALVGKLSTKLFHKGGAANIKKEILDNLDLNIPLPKLVMTGISKIARIRHTVLQVKGKKGGIDVNIGGEMDLTIRGGAAAFDYDLKIEKASGGKTQFQLVCKSKPGEKLTINMVEKMTISNLAFIATKAPGKKWGWQQISGNTTFRSKKVSVDYLSNHSLLINANMTLAEIAGHSGLPVLKDIRSNWIIILPNLVRVDMNIKGVRVDADLWKPQGSSKYNFGFALGNFSPTKFIPGSENSPLKDATFEGLVFIHKSTNGIEKYTSWRKLPDEVGYHMQAIKGPIILKKGLNVYGHLDIHPTGEMAKLLKKVGVKDLKLPLNGTFSPKVFSKSISGGAIKNAILDNLDLEIKLPPLKIPEVDKFLTFNKGILKIKGKMPSGKRGIDVAISGDADVKVKNDKVAFHIDVEYDKAGGSSELSFKGSTEKKWNHPMGIGFLDLDSLTIDIDKKKTGGNSTFDIKMAAKTDIGRHSRLDVKVDIHEKNGKITDAFFELDGPLKLSEIPGVSGIPNAHHFEIDTIKISEHGIEAKTDFGGKKDLDAFLFTGSGWNLILRQDNFAITEFVPPLKNTPLKHVVLSESAIVLSREGLRGPLKSFSPIAQDALKDIYGANAANIDVDSGLSLIAAFEHKNSKGKMADALSRLGLSQERVIMTGDIGGLFGGPVKLDVEVDLSAHTGAKKQPKWMKSKPGVKAVFSIIALENAGQFDIEIGIGADIIANVHGTELVFEAKTALEFEDEKIDIKVVADMRDKKGWRKPFGIPGFTLYDVGFDLGIAEDGAIHLGFDGNIKVSGDKFTVKADAELLPEALGAPQDIAFVGSADKVDMFFMDEIAIAMLGGNFNLDIPGGILPSFTNVKFAFVTPGAIDPDLHITSEGFALAGGMSWLDHEVGKMDVSVSPNKGIYASGKIDDINLGPLHMKNNDFKMDIGVKGLPMLKVDSDIELLGVKERFKIAFDKSGASLDAAVKFGPDFSMTTDLKLSGIDISAKKPNFKNVDFSMDGSFQLDIGKFIADPAKAALNEIFNGLDSAFKKGEADVKAAQNKVNGLTTQINAERAKVRKERAKVEARVQSAENRVNSLQGSINDEWGHYHHCHGWFSKWPCRIKYGLEIGGTKAAKRIADEALELAKEMVAHFPIDLDPRVASLIAARDVAKDALYLAEKTIEGADALDGFMKTAMDKLTNGIENSINIHKAEFKGDLKGVIEHDKPVDLTLDAELFGANINNTFAFKIKDLGYDVERLSLMGLYALHNLVEKGIKDIPGPLENKIKGAIASMFDAKRAANQAELKKYSLAFDKYNKTAELIQADYAAYNLAFLKAELSKGSNPLDHDTSETFAGELIEVGHSGLCLTNIGGLVKQHTCTNGDDRRWSTRPATGAAGVKDGLGYVFIYQPQGGHCISPEGDWKTVATKFGDFTFPAPQFQGDGKITVKGCVNTKEYYWKVLKHGDDWMQIANLATNKCLHFTNSNAVPGKSQAEWQPCVGSANQVYRVADNTTPKYHSVNIVLKSSSGFFMGTANPNDKTHAVPLVERAAEFGFFDYMVDIRGYVKFINRDSGKCLKPGGYALGAKLTEAPCTQLDYQWWALEWVGEKGYPIVQMKIKNAQTNLCNKTGLQHNTGVKDYRAAWAVQENCSAAQMVTTFVASKVNKQRETLGAYIVK